MVTKVQGDLAIDADFLLQNELGVALGAASLDAGGKVPTSQLPAGLGGGMVSQGVWNADTNSPALASGVGTENNYYIVSVAGSTLLDTIDDWQVGDWALFDGTVWQKLDFSDLVSSVFGRAGVVVAASGDYTAGQVTNVAAGGIAATDVQAAINELDSEKAASAHTHGLADITDSGALAALDTVGTAQIDNDAVTAAKLANMVQATLKGRASGAGTGDPTDLTPAQARTILNVEDGANAYVHPNHTGDVTSVADGAQTIAANVVTNAKRATLAADRIRGRANGAGAGDTQDLTAAQVRAILGVEAGATADQSNAEIKTAYEANANTNEFSDAEQTKLAGVETSATADQTNAEIETAYNAQVAVVSQAEAETGTATTRRGWTAERVKQAIAALGGGGGAAAAQDYVKCSKNGDYTTTGAFTDIGGWAQDVSAASFATVNTTTGEITFQKAGVALIHLSLMYGTQTGNNRNQTDIEIQLDTGGGYASLADSRCANYAARNNTQKDGGCSLTYVLTVANGDKIKFRALDIGVALTFGTDDASFFAIDMQGTTGAAGAAGAAGADGNSTDAYTINNKTASYTLALADAGEFIEMNSGSALNLTVPPNSSVAFAVGDHINIVQQGAGQITVVAGGGVTIRTPETLLLSKQYAMAVLIKRATDEWYLEGNLQAT